MKKTRILSLLLVLALIFSLVLSGCSNSNSDTTPSDADVDETPVDSTDDTDSTDDATENPDATDEAPEEIDFSNMSYEEISAYYYEANLGEFYEAYLTAKEEVESLDLRYALMAIAEAKLMESATVIPTNSFGGAYAMARFAPRTSTTVKWGTDWERYHSRILTNELIRSEDNRALRSLWNELKGTGTYMDEAKAYLEEQGYTFKDTYTYSYVSDPATWDVLATSLAVDSEALVNTYDGLLEYDCENAQQPALAESYEVSDDGMTWTFHIRQGVKWVDSQGREVGEVTADDWVAGMQHLLDAGGGLEYLLEGVILNASAYLYGEITDFSQVGVEAVDDYTLVYTLENPTPYFATMMGYSLFAPLCRSYYVSQGGSFGIDYDELGSGEYGSSPNNIAYCGPYLITNWTAQNIVVFSYNESYWNPDGVNVHTITWLYNDGSDTTKGYNDLLAGTVDGISLSSSTLELAKGDGNFDEYVYVSDTDATSFTFFTNLNRGSFANYNDATAAVSPKADNEEEQARTKAAMNNVHFRRALAASIDQVSWNAQVYGDELAAVSLRNSYVPADFVTLETDVTVDINGTSVTYPAGTYYGQIMQDQLDADGVPIKVWDAENLTGDGYDGWYSPDYSASELAIAVEELAAQGVTVDADHPIQIDIVYPSNVVSYTNKAMAFKQSVEATTDGVIVVNTVAGTGYDDWYYATYYPPTGADGNFDINDCTGWSPDYGDPSTYLDTILPEYAGYMCKALGLY